MKNKNTKRPNRKPVIDFINSKQSEIDKLGSFSSYYNDKILDRISIEEWISYYKNTPNQDKKTFITIDARSENEYNEDHLPNSINFPILDNKERDEVGFVYKHISQQAALFLARDYADKKMDKIKDFVEFLNEYKFENIFIYCWRGGGRSSALSIILKENFSLKNIVKIKGGYKTYRTQIYNSFYEKPENMNLISLSGLTGCGKTEILESLTGSLPILDIEKAALHASSLFGKIRFDLKQDDETVNTQTQFENRLFSQTFKTVKEKEIKYFLTESESKKINNFQIPHEFYKHLIQSPTIRLVSSIEKRAERIVEEYFTGDGVERIIDVLENSNFIKKTIGNDNLLKMIELVKTGKYLEFSAWFLKEYYDKRYATNYQNVIAEVCTDDIENAKKEIIKIIKTQK